MHPPESWSIAAAGCPPFSILSAYTDDELDADTAERVGAHTVACANCKELVHEMMAPPPPRGTDVTRRRADCPSLDSLTNYAGKDSQGLDPILERHLIECDPCVSAYRVLLREDRFPAATEAVPASVQARAANAARPAPLKPVVAKHRLNWPEKLAHLLRLPVLMPAGFALGVALYFGAQTIAPLASPAEVEYRAVKELEHSLKATTSPTLLRAAPSLQSVPLAELVRGTQLRVLEERREWYRVALADGIEGWVERSVLP